MNKRVLGVIICLTIVFSGCGKKEDLYKLSKDELVKKVENQKVEIETYTARIKELEELLAGVTEEKDKIPAISDIGDGTGRLTFNSIEGKIKFKQPLQYPKSTQAPKTSSIEVTEGISIEPSKNWLIKIDGNTIELNHVLGVVGVIKAGQVKIPSSEKVIQEELSKFFKEIPPAEVVYNRLFIKDKCWGLEGKAPTRINKEKAYIRCGMFGFGKKTIVYMFVYNGDRNDEKEEAIISLLNTFKVLGMDFRLEG
ncbi:MAG: hypothetical protein QXD03_02590 [Candidatus Anstonellales archaeon]